MAQRHCHSPAAGVVFVGLLITIGYLQGTIDGRKLRDCPPQLADGRALLGRNLTTNECRYAPIPRPAVLLSPIELRRMAAARERMSRIR